MSTDLASESTPAEVDEKIFVLRPYVFACARYDVTYAPWHHRRLPLGDHPCKEQESDVTLRSKSLQYSRFGQMWRRAPPHAILGCYLLFLRLLERQTSRMGLERSRSTFSLAPSDVALPGLFSTTRDLPSLYHDRDWQRNSVCHDPHTSPGLPPLTFRGELQGFWRGKFLMIDFDHYRQILAGDMRGVYTGAFSEQVAEMELRETVVKIRLEEVGGSGPIMNAGYDDEEDDGSPEELRGVENGALPKIVNENEPDDPGWTKEILLSGKVSLID